MSHRDDRTTLVDIRHACQNIGLFIANTTRADFREDPKTQAAVQHQIMIIGEAAKLLSDDFRQKHENVSWNTIARMRDRLIHGYSTVDLDVVWDTATGSIPVLLEAVVAILQKNQS